MIDFLTFPRAGLIWKVNVNKGKNGLVLVPDVNGSNGSETCEPCLQVPGMDVLVEVPYEKTPTQSHPAAGRDRHNYMYIYRNLVEGKVSYDLQFTLDGAHGTWTLAKVKFCCETTCYNF